MQFSFSKNEINKFKRLNISAIILFGSHAQKKSGPLSDFDFGILVKDKSILYSSKKRGEIYDALYNNFSSHIKQLVDIDIVFLETAPYELQAHAMKHGKVIYEAEKNVFADYKAKVMIHYADFAPLRDIFHKGILSRIP